MNPYATPYVTHKLKRTRANAHALAGNTKWLADVEARRRKTIKRMHNSKAYWEGFNTGHQHGFAQGHACALDPDSVAQGITRAKNDTSEEPITKSAVTAPHCAVQ